MPLKPDMSPSEVLTAWGDQLDPQVRTIVEDMADDLFSRLTPKFFDTIKTEQGRTALIIMFRTAILQGMWAESELRKNEQ